VKFISSDLVGGVGSFKGNSVDGNDVVPVSCRELLLYRLAIFCMI